MEYNSSRKKMQIPEYGRHLHRMVEHALTIQDKGKRAETCQYIIEVMGSLNSNVQDISDYRHKLWDQLYIMSDFKLDVESEYEKPTKEDMYKKPERLSYPKKNEKYRYYGHNIQLMINKLISWEEGDKKEALKWIIANHMKKCYVNWNKETVDDKIIFDHLKLFSNGAIDLTKTEEPLAIVVAPPKNKTNKNRRSKRQKRKYS